MRSLTRFFTAVLIMLLPFSAFAHGYWIETEGTHKVNEAVTVKLFFGEYGGGIRSSGKALDKMKDIKVSVSAPGGEKQQITMKQLPDYWEGTFVPQTEGAYEITGINDVRDVQDWTQHKLGITRPIQYLKMQYNVGKTIATTRPTSLFLDMQVKAVSTDQYEVSVIKNGTPLPSQKVILSAFRGEEKELNTDTNGKTTFTLDNPALHVLSLDWIDTTPGEFHGKKYETVRHRLDLSIHP